jgi:hypothetical protein
MAQLLRQAIDSGAPPSMARLPMTPEEVAASYDELDDEANEANESDKAEEELSGASAVMPHEPANRGPGRTE